MDIAEDCFQGFSAELNPSIASFAHGACLAPDLSQSGSTATGQLLASRRLYKGRLDVF